jgi:hypothetical protein
MMGVGFRVLKFPIVNAPDLESGQLGTVPPGNGDPGVLEAAVSVLGRDHHVRREPQTGGMDRLIVQTATMKVVETAFSFRSPEAAYGLLHEV